MGATNAVRNATEARALGKDVLMWCAQEVTDTSILPQDTATPTARTQTDLDNIIDHWLQFGELSIVAKRQVVNGVGAYGKSERTEKEHPWVVTMTLPVGQIVLGFEKREAPLHVQRRMSKPPKPWAAEGRRQERQTYRQGAQRSGWTGSSSGGSASGHAGGAWSGSSWSNSGGSWSGHNNGSGSNYGNSRSILSPATQAKSKSEEDTLRDLLADEGGA
jgi:hypothetical protein